MERVLGQKLYILIACLVIFLFAVEHANAQATVSIRVVKLFTSYTEGGSGGYEYRWNLRWTTNKFNDSNRDNWSKLNNCFKKGTKNSGWHDFNTTHTLLYNSSALPSQIQFDLEGFETDGGSDCGYGSKKDDAHGYATSPILNFSNFVPGVWQDVNVWTATVQSEENNSGKDDKITVTYSAHIQIKYTLPPITGIAVTSSKPTEGNICAETDINLKALSYVPNSTGVSYQWEYYIQDDDLDHSNPEYEECFINCSYDGDCDHCYYIPPTIREPNWRSLPGNTNTITVNPDKDLGGILFNTNIKFRVKAYASGTSTNFYENADFNSFSPRAPTVIASNILSTPACKGKPNGQIVVSEVNSFNNEVRWVLRGEGNTQPCDPQKPGSCLQGKSGYIEGKKIVINDVPAGKYTLIVSNPGYSQGVCYTPYNVSVGEYEVFSLSASSQELSCNNATDGKISFSVSGGSPSVTYKVIKEGDTDTLFFTKAETINNLSAGNYTVVAKDICNELSQLIVISNPTIVKGKIITEPSTCYNPGRGKLFVSATKGSGKYNYSLYKFSKDLSSQSLITELAAAGGEEFNSSALVPGKYLLSVRDSERPNCTGFDTSFVINPPLPLQIDSISKNEVTCPGGSNGYIYFRAIGVVGKFKYSITNLSNSSTLENTLGEFENLIAGKYILIVKSGVEGCLDSFSSDTVVISQPANIIISTSKTDVKCNGDKTGSIRSNVVGGTGTYKYSWETLINNEWYASSDFESNISNIWAGEYRVKVTDEAECYLYSEKVAIVQPEKLVFAEVVPKRYGCKGTEISFVTLVKGGVPPYTTKYSVNDGPYTSFESSSILGLGSYKMSVFDANGCMSEYPHTIPITNNALLVNAQVFPSCYKSTTGRVEVAAYGGEEPYSYSKDNGKTFQNSSEFNNLLPGTYSIVVKDNRGCQGNISATVLQKQDTPEINFLVSTRQNALDTLIITEISIPKPDSIVWTFDPLAVVLDPDPANPLLKFEKEGTYTISMTGYFDGCNYTLTKQLSLNPYDPIVEKEKLPGYRPIEKMVVSPNPSDGRFNIKINLLKKQQLLVIIYDIIGNEVVRKRWDSVLVVDENIDLGNVVSGSFIVRAITDNDARESKVIVNK